MLCVFIAGVVACLAMDQRSPAAAWEDLCALVRSAHSQVSYVQAVYVPTEDAGDGRVGEVVYGFEPGTGAWYSAQASSILGRTRDGRAYVHHLDDPGQTLQWVESRLEEPPFIFMPEFPSLVIAYLCERPADIQRIDMSESGEIVLYHSLRRLAPNSPASAVSVFATDGRLVRRTCTINGLPDPLVLDAPLYSDRSIPGLSVMAHTADGRYRLASITMERSVAVGAFRPEAVRAIAQQCKYNVEAALAAKRQGFNRTPDGDWSPGLTPQPSRRTLVHRPLLLAGSLFLAAALVVLWKRRHG